MEKSFQNILEIFSEPQTRHISEEYLKKYWLNDGDWQSFWQPLKDKIFRSESTCLPDMMFKDDFALIALIGGVVFTEDDFKALQNCMLEAGDKWFVIVENKYMQPVITGNDGKIIIHLLLQFKFPVEITWDELLNGGLISMELFETSYKDFFVFGDSGKWGKYAANEYWDTSVDPAGTPLDIIGFKPELAHIFQEHFRQPKEEQEEIREWLPLNYKGLIK
jgi:hypothetical protein